MTTTWYKGAIIFLLALNGILAWKLLNNPSQSHSQRHEIANFISRPAIPEVTVADRSGRMVSLRELAARRSRTLLIVFSPSDCPPCLEERTLWGQIARRLPVAVYGIGVSPSPSEFWAWESKVTVPVETYLDTTFAFVDSMAFRVTPLKILVSSTGTALWVDPPRLSREATNAFWEDLSSALDIPD